MIGMSAEEGTGVTELWVCLWVLLARVLLEGVDLFGLELRHCFRLARKGLAEVNLEGVSHVWNRGTVLVQQGESVAGTAEEQK